MCAIRHIVRRDFFANNEPPTLKKIHAAVRADSTLPNLCLGTVHKILKELGFVYTKAKRNSNLIERPDIIEWRHRYLRKIRKHRADNRNLVYTDETWCNAGHTMPKKWKDTTIASRKDAFLKGLTTGLKEPSGKGERLIVTHAGNRDGFIPGAELIFRAKKGDGDYHSEMNSDVYEKWFKTQLLPNIPPNSVIILDNASYHSAMVELLPRRGWRKDKIRAWLDNHKIPWTEDMIIAELLKLVEPLRPQFEKRRIDELAKAAGHELLRLPPYHCELNAIELVSEKCVTCEHHCTELNYSTDEIRLKYTCN